jgi:hypothetical protein
MRKNSSPKKAGGVDPEFKLLYYKRKEKKLSELKGEVKGQLYTQMYHC